MQERLLGRAEGTELGDAVLYFGCRRSDQDYLYGDLLEQWAATGALTLFTAFSRQQVNFCPLVPCHAPSVALAGTSARMMTSWAQAQRKKMCI